MNWSPLTSIEQLEKIKEESSKKPVIIFKHSSRCSISSAALDRLERKWAKAPIESVSTYFLDLIRHRDVSQSVADTFNVFHQSPQLLLIQNGESVYDESHFGIDYDELQAALNRIVKS